MQITAYKCEQCGDAIFESEKAYENHMAIHKQKDAINEQFPPVKDLHCEFANGGWSIVRDAKWLTKYRHTVEALVASKRDPWTYGWMRELDDSGTWQYEFAVRVLNVCPTCYREWGQAYYANNCPHNASKDKVE
jgi:hypothetical protein